MMAPLYGVTGSPGDTCLVQLYWVLDGCDSESMDSTFYFFQFLYSIFLGEMRNIPWGAGGLYREESSLITFWGVQT